MTGAGPARQVHGEPSQPGPDLLTLSWYDIGHLGADRLKAGLAQSPRVQRFDALALKALHFRSAEYMGEVGLKAIALAHNDDRANVEHKDVAAAIESLETPPICQSPPSDGSLVAAVHVAIAGVLGGAALTAALAVKLPEDEAKSWIMWGAGAAAIFCFIFCGLAIRAVRRSKAT